MIDLPPWHLGFPVAPLDLYLPPHAYELEATCMCLPPLEGNPEIYIYIYIYIYYNIKPCMTGLNINGSVIPNRMVLSCACLEGGGVNTGICSDCDV